MIHKQFVWGVEHSAAMMNKTFLCRPTKGAVLFHFFSCVRALIEHDVSSKEFRIFRPVSDGERGFKLSVSYFAEKTATLLEGAVIFWTKPSSGSI